MTVHPNRDEPGRKSASWMPAASAAALILAPLVALAEPAQLPFRVEKYDKDTSGAVIIGSGMPGAHPMGDPVVTSLSEEPKEKSFVTVETVWSSGAAWLSLRLSDFDLGQHSKLTFRSVEDGAEQSFTSETLKAWNGATAAFNGNAVQVILEASPLDDKPHYKIDDVIAGLPQTSKEAVGAAKLRRDTRESAKESKCGANDDRKPSSDPRIGRIVPIGCTGWLIDKGLLLTAGHCIDPAETDLLEFNVPRSSASGIIRHPAPKDQYKIRFDTIAWSSDSEGNDWAVFAVEKNTETGLYPVQAQGGFFKISQDKYDGEVRVTGFGVSDNPQSANQIQQTHAGDHFKIVEGPNDTSRLSYTVDTEGGNSGSPVIVGSAGTGDTAVGIHTNGGCKLDESEGNGGTSFRNPKLWQAIETYKDKPSDLP